MFVTTIPLSRSRKEAKSLRFQPISRNAINLKEKKWLVEDK
jgi:hypothetical protein